jgi:hypothetical protein
MPAAASRRSWCSRSCVAAASAAASPEAKAATSSAVRPTLNTASSNGTPAGSAVRESLVDVVSSGIHNTTSGRSGVSMRTAAAPSVATMPPNSEAATLSA